MAKKEELVLNVKSNIGTVAEEAKTVNEEVVKATESTGKLSKAAENAGTAAKKGAGGFKKLGGVIKGVGMALKAAGIGLVMAVVAKLMEVFSSNQKVVDTFQTSMNALTIAFNDLFKFLSENVGAVTQIFKDIFENPQESIKEFGDMIKNNLIERFESFLDTLGYMSAAFGELFAGNFKEAGRLAKEAGKEMVDTMTGVDGTFDKVKETVEKGAAAITDYSKKTWNSAKALTAAEKAAKLAQAEFAKLNAEYLKEQEDQRQIRDDITKTFATRIEANEKLAASQKKQMEEQEAALKVIEAAAQARYNAAKTDENLLPLLEAQTAVLEIQEAINGQMSEQKTNQVALEQELLDAQRELNLVGREGADLELAQLEQDYEYKLDLARRAGVDRLEIDKWYQAEVLKINKKGNEKDKALAQAKKNMQLDMANQAVALVGQAAGEGTALAKAAAVTQATIAGVQGVQNAFTAANANIGATAGSFGAYPLTMAGLAAGFAALNISKILSGSPTSPGDVSAAGGGGGAEAATPAPQMMSGAFELGGGIEPEPLKAFVVTDEMTNSQNQLANIRRRATI